MDSMPCDIYGGRGGNHPIVALSGDAFSAPGRTGPCDVRMNECGLKIIRPDCEQKAFDVGVD